MEFWIGTLIALVSVGLTIAGMTFWRAVQRGRDEVNLSNLLNDMETMKETVHLLRQNVLQNTEQIRSLIIQEQEMKSALHELRGVSNVNNERLASLNATMLELNKLLQNIFDGNLKIARSGG